MLQELLPLRLNCPWREADSASNGRSTMRVPSAYYWSSTVSGASAHRPCTFNSSHANLNSYDRAFGSSVRCLKDDSPAGSIGSLDCPGAVIIGTLTEGVAAIGVSATVGYTGGNGGTHSGQTVTSTGVTGPYCNPTCWFFCKWIRNADL